jgi:tRNA(His) 5'-end guanylyltransferase
MKGYEATSQSNLLRRTPVLIRVDGRAFHTFTRKLIAKVSDDERLTNRRVVDPSLKKTPFSEAFHKVMTATSASLFKGVQNAVLVYTQSDEISILLRDWDKHQTQQWFGSNVQKMCSLSASIATAAFNHYFGRLTSGTMSGMSDLATFDSRVYNLPRDEVTNYFIWRQQDASRNSVNMLGRFYFSQKQIHAKNLNQVQDMLMLEHGVNWNDIPTWMKRGACVYQRPDYNMFQSSPRWFVDDDIPIFTQDRHFVERHLYTDNELDAHLTTLAPV